MVATVVAGATAVYALRTGRPQTVVRDWMLHHGYMGHLTQNRASELPRVVLGWARGLWPTGVPTIHIDVKFKHMQRLWTKREEALASGVLIQGPDDLVPATIRLGNRTVRTRIRLKGDWVDHLTDDRWAFRIHVRRGDHIFGMRRFSLHHPRARDYHGEPLFHEMLRSQGLAAPRYMFVNVVLNGDDLGLLALEEHFSKELLEAHGRREGVILRFDESMAWSAYDRPGFRDNGVFNNFRLAVVKPFRGSKVALSPQLTAEFATAAGLLRGFASEPEQARSRLRSWMEDGVERGEARAKLTGGAGALEDLIYEACGRAGLPVAQLPDGSSAARRVRNEIARAATQELGLSGVLVARRLGVSPATVSRASSRPSEPRR